MFWSGTISFGLVSIPVSLVPANRSNKVRLHLLTADGKPLRRAYFSSKTGDELNKEEVERGFELEQGEYVPVTDEELEGLAPEQSRDIDLRLFVAREEVPPIYFERAYFLLPGDQTAKAYRLLAEVMERTGRAGIATFVMRGKQYLVAILADRGFLRAETLRFQEEIRTPEDLGLPADTTADSKLVQAFSRVIEQKAQPRLSMEEMKDVSAAEMLELINQKRQENIDVVEVPDVDAETAAPADETGEPEIDILQVLKRSLAGAEEGKRKRPAKAYDVEGLERESRAELLKRAKALNIPGRSSMAKEELIEALRQSA
jgi:DNA end-binding protein Ku